jgi:drug/metabolite transporter (DMT)-like permease
MFTKTDIEKYFLAEKQESMLFIFAGIVAIALALLFLFLIRGNFYKGAAIPLLLVGAIQLVAGYTVYKRSDDDRSRNVYAYDMNPGQLKQEELPRMQKVNSNFVIYRWVEIIVLLAGIGLIVYFRSKPGGQLWFGLGLTLAIEAAILLGADYVAAQRAQAYTKGIETFLEKLR